MDGCVDGRLLDGKYRLGPLIGAGGMGVVYAARHVKLRTPCAVKVLRTERRDATHERRLLREARLLGAVADAHTVRVFDVGALADGSPYLVMELLEGESVAERLVREGPLPPMLAVSVARQVCDVLAVAHERNIIHRDLKPSNLFLVRNRDGVPVVKVLDFGLAKDTSLGPDDSMATASEFAGSPRYMSPEQIRASGAVDFRTDLWSLGVTLFEMLVGATPFGGRNNAALLAAIVCDPPQRLAQLWPDAPRALDVLLAECLESDPEARPPSARDLSVRLRGLLQAWSSPRGPRPRPSSGMAELPQPSDLEPSTIIELPKSPSTRWSRLGCFVVPVCCLLAGRDAVMDEARGVEAPAPVGPPEKVLTLTSTSVPPVLVEAVAPPELLRESVSLVAEPNPPVERPRVVVSSSSVARPAEAKPRAGGPSAYEPNPYPPKPSLAPQPAEARLTPELVAKSISTRY